MPHRVLFVAFAEPGHLNPLLCVAQRLAARGHALAFHAPEDVAPRVAAAGLDATCFSTGAAPRAKGDSAGLARRLASPGWQKKFLAMALLDPLPAQVESVEAAVRAFQPDLLCIDPMAWAGVIVAERRGLPWAGLSTNLVRLAPPDEELPYLGIFDALAPERDARLAAFGVTARFAASDALSPFFDAVFATDAVAPAPARRETHLVGPSLPLARRGDEGDFPWHELPADRPLVYVAFGSQFSPPAERVREIVLALRDEAHVVVAAKDLLPALAGLGAGVTAVGWAPQLALLERAAAFVTHGGANSVMECLARGRPALVVPLAHDQALQARLVERSGAGIALALDGATGEGCRDAVRALLAAGSPHRARAEAIGRSLSARDGAAEAAALVERLAATRAPVLREA